MDIPSQSDTTLVTQAKGGDFTAFEALVTRHEGRAYSIAMNILRNREDAEDAVQDAFISVLKALPGFREEASFRTWLTRIVVNAALKALRKRKGRATVAIHDNISEDARGDIPHPNRISSWPEDPARIMEQKDLRALLLEAIGTLNEKHRIVFVLRDMEGLSVRETAEALDLSESNVKVRLLRARLALREKLAHHFAEETAGAPATHTHAHDGPASTPAAEILESYQKSYNG